MSIQLFFSIAIILIFVISGAGVIWYFYSSSKKEKLRLKVESQKVVNSFLVSQKKHLSLVTNQAKPKKTLVFPKRDPFEMN